MIFRRIPDIPIDENKIKKNQIPILIKDEDWKNIIGNSNNKTIQNFSNELENLLKEEEKLKKELIGKRSYKAKLMDKILHLSDLINRQGKINAMPELERCQSEIVRVNPIIDDLEGNLATYPLKIQEANLALLKETISIIYKDVSRDYTRLHLVDDEILKLRARLGDLRDEKEGLERKIGVMYSFLHTILGHEEMEKLDLHFLKDLNQ